MRVRSKQIWLIAREVKCFVLMVEEEAKSGFRRAGR
jgi:hypothetical protein